MPIYFGQANNNGGCGFHFVMTLSDCCAKPSLPKIMSIKAHFEQYFSQIFQFEHNWLDFTIFKDKNIMYL